MGRAQNVGGSSWSERLARGETLLLDAALGTGLERLGIDCALPLWSAPALWTAADAVRGVHAAHAAAGADLLTANSFRTQRRTLERAGLGDRATELCRRAVALAREAAAQGGHAVAVLGSVAPLEDCYRPDLVPSAAQLEREHAEHIANLVAAGAEGLLLETLNTLREAICAAEQARASGLPFLLSFVCGAEAKLLSGEPLAAALDRVAGIGAQAVLVNCLPPRHADAAAECLARSGLRWGVYANRGAAEAELSPEGFAARAEPWLAAGAQIVGGCCGTTAADLRALRARMDRRPPA